MHGHATLERPAGPYMLLLFGLLPGIAVGCVEREGVAAPPRSAPSTIQARLVQVAEQEWPQSVATQGDLVADETAVLGAKVAGRIDHVPVDLGDFVTAGTVVASLDRREYQERLRQAEAELAQTRAAIGLDADDDLSELDPHASPIVVEQKALWDQARADRERISALLARQAATDAQYEAAVAAEQVAKARHVSAINSVREKIAMVRVRTAQLEVARQELADAEIRAPFDGRIQERHVSPGTYVRLGDPVVTLIRDDPLRYRGTVPEPYASDIAIGQRVRLWVATGTDLPDVTITRISPALDPFSRSLLFEARVPNPNRAIQAGRFIQGEVILDHPRRVVALPESAVVEFAGTQKVWKVVDGLAVEQSVETGAKREHLVEVLAGVEPGDQVLIDGTKGRSAKVETQEIVTSKSADTDVGSSEISAPH